MSAPRDHIDEAIDHVAASLTRVADDDGFALRIVTALPQRSRWSTRWLMPRLAFTAAIAFAAALIVQRTFYGRSTDVLRAGVISSPTVELAAAAPEHRTTVEPSSNVPRTIVERLSNDRRTREAPDFDRSLEALGGLPALSLTAVAPSDLPVQGALALEPLAIVDLPLSAESFSPRH